MQPSNIRGAIDTIWRLNTLINSRQLQGQVIVPKPFLLINWRLLMSEEEKEKLNTYNIIKFCYVNLCCLSLISIQLIIHSFGKISNINNLFYLIYFKICFFFYSIPRLDQHMCICVPTVYLMLIKTGHLCIFFNM